ncbi:MAG: collagen-like protein [Oscillospiraceae bacterium]|nr:collagen-like protein [Oscillospiraceae bacterium]
MSAQRNYYNHAAARAAAAKARNCVGTPMTPPPAITIPAPVPFSPAAPLPAALPSRCGTSEDTVCYTVKHGATGPMGPAGCQGPIGPAGAPGARGATGAMGPQGHQGHPGHRGATGAMGPMGPIGSAGAPGAAGPQGQRGAQGPAGCQGPQGPAGPSELYMVNSQVCNVPPHHVVEDMKAICPPGMICISGGYQSDNHDLTVIRNTAVDSYHAWEVSCYNNTNRPCSVQAYAICVPECNIKPLKEPRMAPNMARCKVKPVPCQPPAYPSMNGHF